MKAGPLRVLAALTLAGCGTLGGEAQGPAHPVEAVRKVVDGLAAEVAQRSAAEPFRNLPIVVRTTATASGGIEPIIAEFLRTRLVERGMAVDAACPARCMEVILQEFAIDAPKVARLTPGQVVTVVGGNIPVFGGLIRSLGESERERERAAARATGLIVTFAAREANRYTARVNVVTIVSSSDGALALEQK